MGYMNQPYFVLAFPDAILHTELPIGYKVSKFSKFLGKIGQSTTKHIVRYQMEYGDIATNEYLKMEYFPNSLTKNAFTWFTTLPPNSIYNWP